MGRSINRALVRQTNAMQRSAEHTILVTQHLSMMHRYAAAKASTTVVLAHHLVNAATYSGRMTPRKLAEFHSLTQEYLDQMTYLTEEASFDLILLLAEKF